VTALDVGRSAGSPLAELRKLSAFLRRDLLVLLSYRVAFVSDIVGLLGQILVFYFIGKMIAPSSLPTYGGTDVTYLEFASVGIAIGVFLQVGFQRVSTAIRGEQLMGTLESVMMTPTAPSTVQLGSVAFDLIYVPLRTAIFLGAVAVVFGIHFDASGIAPAIVVLLAFIPFVWGIGIASAGMVLTFRRGAGAAGVALIGIGLLSGAYFPLDLLPGWLQAIADFNPMALAVNGMRESLLGGSGWSEVGGILARLVPLSAVSLVLGLFVFRAALRRERAQGTLGLY
jgi:ABC-2 type transport system permease protein